MDALTAAVVFFLLVMSLIGTLATARESITEVKILWPAVVVTIAWLLSIFYLFVRLVS